MSDNKVCVNVATSSEYKASNSARYSSLRKLATLSIPEAPRIVAGISGLIVNSITNLSFPWLMGQAIDRAGNGNVDLTCGGNNAMICGLNAEYFWFLMKAAGIFVCGSVASWVRVYCLGTSTDLMAKKLRKLLFGGYLSKKIEFYDATRTGDMVSVLEKDVSLASLTMTDRLAAGVRSLNSSINGSILLFTISPKLCYVTLAIVPVVGIGAMSVHKLAKRCRESLRELEVGLLSYVMERLGSITTVKVNHQEQNEIAHFNSQTDEVYEMSCKAHFAQGSMMGFIGLATNFSLMSILFVGGDMLAKRELTSGELTRFAIQSAFVGLGFSGLASFYKDLIESLDGAGRVYAAVDANVAQMEKNQAESLTTDAPSQPSSEEECPEAAVSHAVVLRDVSYTYASRPDQVVLNSLNMDVKTGSFSCIVGPSGVGKSTLFGLLCGLHSLESNSGSITICGRSLASVNKDWLHRNVSVVEQGCVGLLSGSILFNVLYGNNNADEAAAVEAARQAMAHDFISAFPEGYDTKVRAKNDVIKTTYSTYSTYSSAIEVRLCLYMCTNYLCLFAL